MKLLPLAIALSLAAPSEGFGANRCEDEEQQSSKGCLLELGDAPGKNLIPGILAGEIDPAVVSRAAGSGATTRIWSEPSGREPGMIDHHIAVKGPLIDVLGTHDGKPPYGVEQLAIRDPSVQLPCGMRVGQPLAAFVAALGPPYPQDPPRRGVAEWYWAKFEDRGMYCTGAHATISLRLGAKNEVQEVRWDYYAD
jgi:hypothetical protein